ncbi:MAG TPA: TolC family protein [Bacteroidota bacterium]|jgi:outer membrane protein TolC
MKQLILCLSLIAAHSPRVFTQTDSISLKDALEIAQKNNPAIKIAEIGIRQDESRLREVTSARYPALAFRSHYLYTPETGYNEAVTNGGEYGVQLATGLPLFDGGVRSAQIDQSTNEITKSQAGLHKSSAELAFNVRIQYYETLRAEEEALIRGETVARLQDYLTFVNQLRLGGNATESDRLKTQVDLNNSMIASDGAVQAVQKSKRLLSNLLGRAPDREIEVLPLDGDTSGTPVLVAEENPELQLLDRERKSADYGITIAKGERLPTLTLAGDVGALGIHLNELHHDFGYSVFLSLEVPIFSWGGIDNRIEQRELALEQLDAQLLLQQRTLEVEWRNATSDLNLARLNLTRYRANIEEAEKNYLSAKSRFAGGSGLNLEVLDAHRLWVEAKLNYSSTLFTYRASLAELYRLSGK